MQIASTTGSSSETRDEADHTMKTNTTKKRSSRSRQRQRIGTGGVTFLAMSDAVVLPSPSTPSSTTPSFFNREGDWVLLPRSRSASYRPEVIKWDLFTPPTYYHDIDYIPMARKRKVNPAHTASTVGASSKVFMPLVDSKWSVMDHNFCLFPVEDGVPGEVPPLRWDVYPPSETVAAANRTAATGGSLLQLEDRFTEAFFAACLSNSMKKQLPANLIQGIRMLDACPHVWASQPPRVMGMRAGAEEDRWFTFVSVDLQQRNAEESSSDLASAAAFSSSQQGPLRIRVPLQPYYTSSMAHRGEDDTSSGCHHGGSAQQPEEPSCYLLPLSMLFSGREWFLRHHSTTVNQHGSSTLLLPEKVVRWQRSRGVALEQIPLTALLLSEEIQSCIPVPPTGTVILTNLFGGHYRRCVRFTAEQVRQMGCVHRVRGEPLDHPAAMTTPLELVMVKIRE